MKELFFENIGSIWERFLNFEINRSREAIKYFNNANSYSILQTIDWHKIHLIPNEESFQDYARMRKNLEEKFIEFEKSVLDKLSF